MRFAQLVRDTDIQVATDSLWEAARSLLFQFTRGWEVIGGEKLPKEGPLLVVANHPGGVDSIALLGVLTRPDVHLLVNRHPALEALPNAGRHFIFVDEHNPHRLDLMREIIGYLKAGEVVAIFPRGKLEPDPVRYPGALASVESWSQSLGVFLNQVPETRLQLVLIENVLSKQAWNHLFARLGNTNKARHQIGTILQIGFQQVLEKWKIPVQLTLSDPVTARELAPSLDPRELNAGIQNFVIQEMKKTFDLL